MLVVLSNGDLHHPVEGSEGYSGPVARPYPEEVKPKNIEAKFESHAETETNEQNKFFKANYGEKQCL